jgi:hypothetical protein
MLLITATACDNVYDAFWDLCAQDAAQYPKPWTAEAKETFVIADKTLRSMSSCGLLETYYTCPDRTVGPWCSICSNTNVPGVTMFNEEIENDKVVLELFKRDDCLLTLYSKFQTIINRRSGKGKGRYGKDACLEMLLASDLCMSVLNDKADQRTLMQMALEMIESDATHIRAVRHIMVAIMKKCNYTPFLEEAAKDHPTYIMDVYMPGLTEWMEGYTICGYTDIVEKYAIEFLDE